MNVPAILGLIGLCVFLLAAILLYICKKRFGVEPQSHSSATRANIVNSRQAEEWDALERLPREKLDCETGIVDRQLCYSVDYISV